MAVVIPDISRYQGKVDFVALRKQCTGVVIKATGADDPQSGLYIDSMFAHDRDAARAAGLTCWFYHFKGVHGSATQQAAYFVKAVGALRSNERLVLDDENEGRINAGFIAEFADTVKKLTGKTIVVYSNLGRFQGADMSSIKSRRIPTWVADYNLNTGAPSGPKPSVANMLMWQYTSLGRVAGVNGPVDLSLYYGSQPFSGGQEEVQIETTPPVFNKDYYNKVNPDVPAHKVDAEAHWLHNGISEGRPSAPNFHVKEYIANYPDLQRVFGAKKDYAGAVKHYFNSGIEEGRYGTKAAKAAVDGTAAALADANKRLAAVNQPPTNPPVQTGLTTDQATQLSRIDSVTQAISAIVQKILNKLGG